MQALFLRKHEDRRIRAGHLWVFSNEVDVKRSPLTAFTPGEAANLLDAGGRPLGTVYVNPASLIAARIVSRATDDPLNAGLLKKRLIRALALREHLFSVPFYRLCHGEGDFLPGLVLDRFGDVFSAQLTTAGMDACRDDLLEVLTEVFAPSSVLFRNDLQARSLEGLPLVVEAALGQPPESIEVQENGACFEAPLSAGQKTGWFYDQRVNRLEAAALARPTGMSGGAGHATRILDAFCYAGGFGVMAGRAATLAQAFGAGGQNGNGAHVTFLDASAPALAFAERNLRRNAPDCECETLAGDAFEQLKSLADEGRRFELVCLDPPAFIKRKKDAEKGLSAYRRVTDLGLQLVEDGGILVVCSCSHHLAAEDLRRLLAVQSAKRGVSAQIVRQGGQGPDHPIHPAMPETSYLKTFTLRVSREGSSRAGAGGAPLLSTTNELRPADPSTIF